MKPRKGQIISIALHGSVVFALLHVGAVQQIRVNRPGRSLDWSATKIVYHLPKGDASGSGAGPDKTPPSQGVLPRITPRPFVPPTTRVSDHQPALPIEPAILGETRTQVPADIIGDPASQVRPPSDGSGGPAGIGNGPPDGGIGNRRGPRAGKGPGGNVVGGAEILTSTNPVVLYKIEPDFTEEARKARLQGTVSLLIDIDARGQVSNIRVRSPLGLGLDEKAIEAVRKWRFKPATRNGLPVSTTAVVEVNFRLL